MTIQIVTPQFERVDGKLVFARPSTIEEFENLRTLSEAQLKDIGCGIWNKEDGVVHWLFPKEWYDHIPHGLMVACIDETTFAFESGETDDDTRFGMLAYGFLQNV